MSSQNDRFLELLAAGNTLEGQRLLQSDSSENERRWNLNRTMYGPSTEEGLESVREAESAHLERLTGEEGQIRANTLYNLGCFSLMQDDILAARMRFSEAVKLDPGNLMSRHNLAYAHELLAEFEEAKSEYEAILAINPSLGMTRLNLALVRLQESDVDSAIEDLEQLNAQDPSNLGLLLYLVRALLYRRGENDTDRVLTLLDLAPNAGQYPPLQECRAFALFLKEDMEAAEPILQALHEANPEDLFARMGLVKILGAHGNFSDLTEALEAYNSRDPSERIDAILTDLHTET